MTKEFVDKLTAIVSAAEDALPEGATIECRSFFGGAAAYVDGRIFVSLTKVGLGLKLADEDRRELIAKGGRPLRYFPKAPIKKSYAVVPASLRDDPPALKSWLAKSVTFALSLPNKN